MLPEFFNEQSQLPSKDRKKAFEEFLKKSEPTGKEEEWKHTPLSEMDLKNCLPLQKNYSPKITAEKCIVKEKGNLESGEGDKIQLLVQAFSTSNKRIIVPEKAKASVKIRVNAKKTVVYNNIIEIEEGSTIDYFEELKSANSELIHACKTIFLIGNNATLNYYVFQDFGEKTWSFAEREFVFGNKGKCNLVQCELGGRFSRSVVVQRFEGDDSSCLTHKTLLFGNGRQHFDLITDALHSGKRTKSDILVKGLLKDEARSVYRGLIKINKEAKGTDSFLADHMLHLSKGVISNSIPSLKIDNNEVSASHGATVSRLNEESLFYLQARGLSKATAQELVAKGFLSQVISAIPSVELRGNVEEKISLKIKRG